MLDVESIMNDNIVLQTQSISELFEQDSRRYSRALTEEQEANAK